MDIVVPNSASLRWVEVDSDGSSPLSGTLPNFSNRLNYHWIDNISRGIIYDDGQNFTIGDNIYTQFTTDATTITIGLYNYSTNALVSDESGNEVLAYTFNNGNKIYNHTLSTTLLGGAYYMLMSFSDGVTTQYFRCEMFEVDQYSEYDYCKIEWSGSERLGVYNPSSQAYYFRFPSRFFQPEFGDEKETYTDSDFELSQQDGAPILNKILELGEVPHFVASKLQLALLHETFKVNGVEYQTEDSFSPETLKDGVGITNFTKGELKLRQVVYEVYTSITDDEPEETAYRITGQSESIRTIGDSGDRRVYTYTP